MSSLHEELRDLLNKYDKNMELYEKHYRECKEVYDAVMSIPLVYNLKAENEFLRDTIRQIHNSLDEENMNPKYFKQDYNY